MKNNKLTSKELRRIGEFAIISDVGITIKEAAKAMIEFCSHGLKLSEIERIKNK